MAHSGGLPTFHLPLPPSGQGNEHPTGMDSSMLLPLPRNGQGSQGSGSTPHSAGGDVELGHGQPQGRQGQPAGSNAAGMARAGSAQPGLQIVTVTDRAGSITHGEIIQQGLIRAGSAQAGTVQAGPTPKVAIAAAGPSASGLSGFTSGSGEISPTGQSPRGSLDAQPGAGRPRKTEERRHNKKYASHMGRVLDKELIRIEARGQDLKFKRAKGAEPVERECRVCLSTDEQAKIISACKCSGTQQWMHYGCLRHWVLEKRALKCELCGSDYSQPYFDSLREELEKLPPRGQRGGAGDAPQGPRDNAFGVPMGTFDPNLGYITYEQLPPGATRPDPTYWPQRLPAPRYALEGPNAGRITVGVVLCVSVCAFIIIVAVAAGTGGGAGGE